MDMDFVGAFELEYGRMVDLSRIIEIDLIYGQQYRVTLKIFTNTCR